MRTDEVQHLIDDGIFTDTKDYEEMQKDAGNILPHICSARCKKRVAHNNRPDDFQCRKTNNLKMSPDNTKHCYVELPNEHTPECIQRLIQIGLIKRVNIIEEDTDLTSNEFESDHKFFHPTRHIPPTNPTHDRNMSPVEGYTFSQLRSMQNVQCLMYSVGANKYICKYIGKMDENNYTVVSTDAHKNGTLISQTTFLHNTKIATSAHHEEKARQNDRNSKKPKGRIISLCEMYQVQLRYPEVHSDMEFEQIQTTPLEFRAGTECSSKSNVVDDGVHIDIEIQIVREQNRFPEWRLHTNSQRMILIGLQHSKISIDKITKFSVRPPELLHIFDQVGNYYRWFKCTEKSLNRKSIEEKLNNDLKLSCFIDGVQHQVRIRKKALPEIYEYIESLNRPDDFLHPICIMIDLFLHIKTLLTTSASNNRELNNQETIQLNHLNEELLYDDDKRHLPVPVYSYSRPTIASQFILHILLSLGHFSTEVDLLLHPNIRESLRYAKLIGPSNDPDMLQSYSDKLLHMFILEQLRYFPNSKRVLDTWIVTAGDLLDAIIIRDEIPIHDLPPVQQTTLHASKTEEIVRYWDESKAKLIKAAHTELESVMIPYDIPSTNDLENVTLDSPLDWNAYEKFTQIEPQTDASFNEQRLAVKNCTNAIDRYCSIQHQSTFIKCRVIAGSPGCGKSFLMNYVLLYAMSKGLKVGISAQQACRAVHLGGLHLHKLFSLPVKDQASIHRLAELAITRLISKPKLLRVLQMVQVLFLDELGQVSSEMLAVLDIILRKVRNSNTYLGGLLIIGTLDHKQLPPVKGKPFMTSPHVLTSFAFTVLQHSVRASGDPDFQRLQNIARLHPRCYEENPDLIDEFKELISRVCTFVPNWSSPLITPNTFRLYSKKAPAKRAALDYINAVRNTYLPHQIRHSTSNDVQNPQNSHQEWQLASESTRLILDKKLKEPRELLFFIGAFYEFTYNDDGKFSQSQIGLLMNLPDQETVNNFRKIPIYVAPPGIKDMEYDPTKTIEQYVEEGWERQLVGTSPERTQSIPGSLRAQRRQYGIKHRLTATIHASMGDTLNKVAMEISDVEHDYKIWEKEQVIVATSRTKLGKDTIFVGDKTGTINALVSILKHRTQWTDYMDRVLSLVSINGDTNDQNRSIFDYDTYPFRIADIPLPDCNTGFVYMLMSLKENTFIYVGESQCLKIRLGHHNSGNGSTLTTPLHLRPYAIIAFICGFDGNKILRRQIERQWQESMHTQIRSGITDAKQIARSAGVIIERNNSLEDVIEPIQLRLQLLFTE